MLRLALDGAGPAVGALFAISGALGCQLCAFLTWQCAYVPRGLCRGEILSCTLHWLPGAWGTCPVCCRYLGRWVCDPRTLRDLHGGRLDDSRCHPDSPRHRGSLQLPFRDDANLPSSARHARDGFDLQRVFDGTGGIRVVHLPLRGHSGRDGGRVSQLLPAPRATSSKRSGRGGGLRSGHGGDGGGRACAGTGRGGTGRSSGEVGGGEEGGAALAAAGGVWVPTGPARGVRHWVGPNSNPFERHVLLGDVHRISQMVDGTDPVAAVRPFAVWTPSAVWESQQEVLAVVIVSAAAQLDTRVVNVWPEVGVSR